jgi:shikimate dehydrogenase
MLKKLEITLQKNNYKLALVGRDISHSKSPEIYKKLIHASLDYRLLDFQDESHIPPLSAIFNNLDGLSITAPYKSHFLNQVKMQPEVKALGAINCIRKSINSKNDQDVYEATNTDLSACQEILPKMMSDYQTSRIIILGNGAMTRIIKAALSGKSKVEIKNFCRKQDGDISELNLSEYDQSLVINCCSRNYLYQGVLGKNCVFWNLNYNQPEQEKLIVTKNASYIDGMSLLTLQAIHALRFWNIG